jgi:hypothetical protein
MRCFLNLTVNIALGTLAGFGIADVATAHSLAPLYYESSGVIGGILAGAARCL